MQPVPSDQLAVGIHNHECLERRVQRAQVHEQLVIGAAVHRAAHARAPLRPVTPGLVREGLAPRRGGAHVAPHRERLESERVPHVEQTLQQQLVHPAFGRLGRARAEQPLLEGGSVARRDGDRHSHEAPRLRVEPGRATG